MNVPAFLAKRFLFGSRRGLPKTVSLLALFGVALGAASLVVAMGLMSGYRHELAEKLAGTSAEVVAMPQPGANVEEQRAQLRALPNVTAVARDALVKAVELPDGLATTRLLGAVPGLAKSFADVEAKGETPVLLGAGLAKRLGGSPGGGRRDRVVGGGRRRGGGPAGGLRAARAPGRPPRRVGDEARSAFGLGRDCGRRAKTSGRERDRARLEDPEPRPLRSARRPADVAVRRPHAHRGCGGRHGRLVARRPPRGEDAGGGRPRGSRCAARARGPHLSSFGDAARRHGPRFGRVLRDSRVLPTH